MAVTINADTSNGLVLTPDTSGEIKLQAGGADIATVTSSGITMASGKTLPASALTGSLPAGMGGKILQVVQTVKSDTFSSTSTSFADVTGLSATITPSSTSNKILVTVSISHGRSSAILNHFKLLRGTTDIAIGDTGGSGTRSTIGSYLGSADSVSDLITSTIQFLDSPSSTSSTTYKIQTKVQASGGTSYVNRSGSDGIYGARTISTITLMEIAG
jgi:hypothetical protein